MWSNEVSPERLAQIFHHYHQALNPHADAQELSAKSDDPNQWTAMPQPEKNRLVATARLVLLELRSNSGDQHLQRPYFAKPGEAEWGA
jgi:hypothetical protein